MLGCVPKEKLPTYNVFYEARTFSRGGPGLALDAAGLPLGDYLFRFDFGTVGVEVCEDAWSPDGPMRRRCLSGAEIIVNVSASPYRMGIVATRREMLATRAADNQTVLVYANAVGTPGRPHLRRRRLHLPERAPGARGAALRGTGEHGGRGSRSHTAAASRTHHLAGRLRTPRAPRASGGGAHRRWRHGQQHRAHYPPPAGGSFFLPPPSPPPTDARDDALDDLFEALAMGIESYYTKTGAFRSLGLALSGGRDSMLTLLVAWRAAARILGRTAIADPAAAGGLITAFYMPSRHSQAATRGAAHELAAALGVALHTIPLDDAYDREVEVARQMLGGQPPGEMTRQNVQARLRGQRMWNWANTSGALFLQTGDMSEKAVGYTTIGGDLEGSLSVIANVPKTVVEALLHRLHVRYGFAGIAATLATLPGPELADQQVAEHELMPFPVLDACLHLYASEKLSPDEVARALRASVRATMRRISRPAPSASRSCSRNRSTSGSSRRSPCTSARSIWIASGRCRCRWCNERSGKGMTSRVLPWVAALVAAATVALVPARTAPLVTARARRAGTGAGFPVGPTDAGANAGRPDDAAQPVFRSGVKLVLVDVSVTGDGDAPLADLTPGDFELTEDGVPQTVEQASLVRLDGAPRGNGEALEIRSQDHALAEAGRDDVRLFAVFMDDYHLGRYPQEMLPLRKALSEFLGTMMGPLDLVTVMNPITPLSALEWTRDRAKLVRQSRPTKAATTTSSVAVRSKNPRASRAISCASGRRS